MDVITQLQQSLAEPAHGFVGAYWPFLLAVAAALAMWFFNPGWRNDDGVVISMSLDDDNVGGGSGGDSGAGGGGDGGGGGD